jgi:hypothetical protein
MVEQMALFTMPPTDDAVSDRQVQELFDYWRDRFDFPARRLTNNRRKHILRVLPHYTMEQLKRVLDTAAADPNCRGQNRNHRPYDDLVNIFRNEERVDFYLRLAEFTDRRASGLIPHGTEDF